jgi:hypothetical protein
MNGAGVTNYDVTLPSYGYSSATTQFDEELIRRGIVTRHQALMAKGMTAAQARDLLVDPSGSPSQTTTTTRSSAKQWKNHNETEQEIDVDRRIHDNDDDDIFDDDNDEFLQEYRRKRLAALQAAAFSAEPRVIDRTEWTRHVNEASHHHWVVVCLTSSDTERTGNMEQAIRTLARQMGTAASTTTSRTTHTTPPPVSFVLIPAHSAIPNWPMTNLPSLFLYRHGTLQQELVRLRTNLTAKDVWGILQTAGAMDDPRCTTSQEDDDDDEPHDNSLWRPIEDETL